jgi:ATP/maltotriose-dependent transcriptional regulator MalT
MGLLSIQISQTEPGTIYVRIMNPGLEMGALSELPFHEEVALPAILKALEATSFCSDDFSKEELDWLRQEGLVLDSASRSYYSQQIREEVGKRLFLRLFPDEKMRGIYDQVRRESVSANEEVHFRLCFDADAPLVGAHPWELLYHEEDFLIGGGRGTLTRYISFDTPLPVQSLTDKLKVLLITPRPSDPELVPLGDAEAQAVYQGVQKAEQEGWITVKRLDVPSFSALEDCLRDDVPPVIHFDGHGAFGRRCPACGVVTQSRLAETCLNSGCEQPLTGVKPQGYLAFQNDQGRTEYVSAQQFADLLRQAGMSGAGVCLVVLSACRSAVARGGESVFNGVAQRLMAAKIPAVVAMQFSIRADAAAQLAEQLYTSIAKREPLVRAMSWCRTRLGREGDQWYRPVLYLRTDATNPDGQLFVREKPPQPPGPDVYSLGRVPPVPNFIGRTSELNTYLEQLRRERYVIITGMAGVGKTTLGAKLARAAMEREEQIFWYTFTPGSKETLEGLVHSLAVFLESRGVSDLRRRLWGEIGTQKSPNIQARLNPLLDGLSSGSGDYLICLDNFHVVKADRDAVGFFELIREYYLLPAPKLPAPIIVIGREVLPGMEHLVSDALRGFSAEEARCFLESPGVQLPPAYLHKLWERTEGNPELLRLNVPTLLAMGEKLPSVKDFEDFIEGMARRGNVRDYLMNNIYAYFTPEDKRVLGALSIFQAPVEREVAKKILVAVGIPAPIERITALVHKSVVSEVEGGCFRLHSLVRDYCYGALDPEDQQRFHQAAARYYEQEQNYLPAAYHYFKGGDHKQALDLLTGHAQDIINAGKASDLVQQLGEFKQPRLSVEQWAALCQAKGDAYLVQGKYTQALKAYESALERVKEVKGHAELLYKIGSTYSMYGKYKLALSKFKESLRISEDQNDRAGIARNHYAMGWAQYRLGRPGQLEQARKHFQVSWDMGRELADELLVARTEVGLGLLDLAKGDLAAARERFEESRGIFHNYDDRVWEAKAVINLGAVYRNMQDLDQAREHYTQAEKIEQELGDVDSLRIIYNNLGDLYYLRKDYPQAACYYNKLRELAQITEHKPMLSTAYAGLADAHLALKELPVALDYAQKAQRVAQEIGPSVELGVSCREQARNCFAPSIPLLQGEDEEQTKAQRGYEEALRRLGSNLSYKKEGDDHG